MKSRKGTVIGTSIHKEKHGDSSPAKFLGAIVADKVGSKLADKGGLMGKLGGAMQGQGIAGAVLNPLAAARNFIKK